MMSYKFCVKFFSLKFYIASISETVFRSDSLNICGITALSNEQIYAVSTDGRCELEHQF
jgi:hypothetical protein